jgi:CheY-like chemotaxis protein
MKNAAFFLVEDEALLRMMTADMLEELGYRVVAEAGTVRAAEPLARTVEFDLAILDINVGGTNIAPIAEILAARGLPFIFVSGYVRRDGRYRFRIGQFCKSRSLSQVSLP